MNIIVRKLKLYRVATFAKFLGQSWKDAGFAVRELHSGSHLGTYLDIVFWYLFYGFNFNDYCTFRFWEKSSEERKTYISFRRNDKLRLAFSNPSVYQLFLKKDKFNKRFEKYVKRKWLCTENSSETDIAMFLQSHSEVIAKPLTDYGGHGVLKFTSSDGNNDLIINNLKRGGYLLEEKISNAKPLQCIAPASLNTIRIVTVIDPEEKLHIICALLRMGNGISFTDNYTNGGMACPIDIETGKLRDTAYGKNCTEYQKHPFSGITFDGFDVYGFDECLKLVKEVAFVEPSARFVGWDFAVTPNGIELIEGNIPPGEDVTQIGTGKGILEEISKLK